MNDTRRMTVGQALVEFLANQWTVDGDHRERTIPAISGIFGHGNVAGLGQAIKQLHVEQPGLLPYHQARNEQAMCTPPSGSRGCTDVVPPTPRRPPSVPVPRTC